MVITVSCPACATSFPVDPDKIPEAGVKARCSECGHVFRVEKPDAAAGSESTPEQPFHAPDQPDPEPDPEPAPATDEWAVERDPFAGVPDAGMGEAPSVDQPAPDHETTSADEARPYGDPWPESTLDAEAPAPREEDPTPAEDAMPDWATGGDLPGLEGDVPDTGTPGPETDADSDQPDAPLDAFGDLSGTVRPEDEAATTPPPDDAAEPAPEGHAPPSSEPDGKPVQGFTFGKRDPMDKARRLARVLVSDMVMYNAQRHQEALARGTLAEDFEEEIEKSWKEFVDQVGAEIAEGEGHRFWTQALNEILAKGQQLF